MKSSKTEIGNFRIKNLWRSNIKSFITGNIIFLSVKKTTIFKFNIYHIFFEKYVILHHLILTFRTELA